ncbi:hypothetical protein ACFYYM_30850 [Streptomyces erythrochromogenes]|uniref:hypothetical protein n=1 Tax=Streptomyces erythrochromogenes TaxID=285574 RepID=UPI0036D1CE78
MTARNGAESAFKNRCATTERMPRELTGYFIGRISLEAFNGLHALAWLRIGGPAEVDVVASTVTVYTAMSDVEAERIRMPG